MSAESELDDRCTKIYWAMEHGNMKEARHLLQNPPLDYAQIIQSLAFLTDEQRAAFFALLMASYCINCGAVAPCQDCPRHLPFSP